MAGREVRSQHGHQVPAHRQAHRGRLRPVPRQQRLQGHAPPIAPAATWRPTRPPRIPTTSRTGFPTTCETCHTTAQWPGAEVRSQHRDQVPAHRQAHHRRVRPVPRQQRLQRHPDRLRGLPPGEVPGDDESESRHGRVPDHLRNLPHHCAMAGRQVRSHHNPLRAHRQTHHGAVHPVPREQRLPRHVDGLLRLPPGEIPGDHQPESHRRRLPAPRARPATRPLNGPGRSSTTAPPPSSRSPGSTPRCCAPSATSITSIRARRRPASAATWRSTRRPRTRITSRPDSPPPAKPATPRRNGREPSSITTRPPSSRSAGNTPRWLCAPCHVNNVYKGTADDLRRLPPGEVQRDHEPETLVGRVPDHLRNLPHHGAVAGGGIQPQHCHQVPADRKAHHRAVRLTATSTTSSRARATTCVGCHLAKYNATTTPAHAAAGFPTTCEICHTTTQWPGAVFAHTTFPLTGKHTTVQCALCHVNNVYKGTPHALLHVP